MSHDSMHGKVGPQNHNHSALNHLVINLPSHPSVLNPADRVFYISDSGGSAEIKIKHKVVIPLQMTQRLSMLWNWNRSGLASGTDIGCRADRKSICLLDTQDPFSANRSFFFCERRGSVTLFKDGLRCGERGTLCMGPCRVNFAPTWRPYNVKIFSLVEWWTHRKSRLVGLLVSTRSSSGSKRLTLMLSWEENAWTGHGSLFAEITTFGNRSTGKRTPVLHVFKRMRCSRLDLNASDNQDLEGRGILEILFYCCYTSRFDLYELGYHPQLLVKCWTQGEPNGETIVRSDTIKTIVPSEGFKFLMNKTK